jgi:hypothetical protein
METHRRTVTALLALVLGTCVIPLAGAAEHHSAAENIAALIAPQKLTTLGKRGANPRVQKYVYWLAVVQNDGGNVANVATRAVGLAGYTNALAAQLTRDAMLRNLKIAEGYGCLDAAGMADMRKGQSPTIQRGTTYQGDQLSVDHVVPFAVCPELDKVIANLELMPLRTNSSKKAKVGSRQVQKAKELHRAGLLSATGLQTVQSTAQ